MAEGRLGTVFVEIDLDKTKFERNQRTILEQSNSTALSIEKNFKILGVKSDAIFQAMANGAINAYTMIANKATASAAEQYRAQAAMVAKVNQLNIEMAKNPLYETLGIKSVASIKAQEAAIMASYNTIKNSGTATAQDLINIERAKNAKLKELNKEMVMEHGFSMARVQRNILRAYATYYIFSQAAQQLIQPFVKGFEAVESYNQSVAALAAMVVTFSKANPGQSQTEQWKEALKYSTAMIPILEKLAARTLLSGEQTTALANAFARSGVFLQANNTAQIEGFTRISNALPLMTKGQEIMRQINTEIRSVMTGQNEQSSMMLQTLKALPGFSKENLEIWRQQGTVLENIGKLLEGFGPATQLLENQWEAVKTTLETTVTQILRGGMLATYGEIILSAKDLDVWLNKNKDSLIDGMSKWIGNFLLTMYTIKAEVLRLAMLLDKMGGTMTSAKMLLYGPGAAMGVESSKKRFGAAAEGNIEYETRYKESEKELEQLAIRYNNLEYSISAAGLAAAKLARDGEAANQKFTGKPGVDKEELKKVQSIQDQITEAIRRANYEREGIGKSEYFQSMARIESEAAKFKKEGQGKVDVTKYIAAEMALINAKLNEDIRQDTIKGLQHSAQVRDEEDKKYWTRMKTEVDAHNREVERATKHAEDLAKEYANTELREREKSADAYKKLVDNNSELALTDHERAINRIKGQATAMEEIIERAYQLNLITAEQADLQSKILKTITDQQIAEQNAKNISDTANYYSTILGYENLYYSKKLEHIIAIRDLEIAAGKDVNAANKKAMQDRNKLDSDVTNLKIYNISKQYDREHQFQFESIKNAIIVADNASALMNKESKEYELMQNIKKALMIAEIAMNIQKNLAIIAVMPAVIAAKEAEAIAGGAAATVNQGTGDPYTAFARIAAMAAIVAGILAAAGIASGGGSSAGASASMPAYGMNTTVLGGENNQGSESIINGWKLLQDTYEMEDTKLTGIYNEMKDLNQNITGLITGIVRMGGAGGNWDTIEFEVFSSMRDANLATSRIFEGALALSFGAIGVLISVLGKWKLSDNLATFISHYITGGDVETSSLASGIRGKAGPAGADQFSGYRLMKQSTDQPFWRGGGTKDIYWNEVIKLSDEVTHLLNTVFGNMSKTFENLAISFGVDAEEALNYSFPAIDWNLQGMTAEAINKYINEQLSAISDQAAKTLFGSIIKQYQKVNEGMLETAVRLATDKGIVEDIIEMTHQTFTGTVRDIIALSESLIELAGGLDKLSSAASTYYDKFFTDTEKQARLQLQLTSALSAQNMVLPTTRALYRDLVEQLDLTNSADQSRYILLLQLADSADKYYTALGDVLNAQNDMTKTLTDQSNTIKQWLIDMNLSPLAPSNSMQAVQNEYNRQKGIAVTSGSTTGQVSDYLNYAKEYLSYMRSFGGDYKAIYNSVLGDVQGMGNGIDLQLEQAKEQTRLLGIIAGNTGIGIASGIGGTTGGAAGGVTITPDWWSGGNYNGVSWESIIAQAHGGPMVQYVAGTGVTDSISMAKVLLDMYKIPYGSGGLMRKPSIAGEIGDEWAVPTYEPQRSNFLSKAPLSFWNNLGINGGGGDGSTGEITIIVQSYIDGDKVAESTAKHIPRNSNLSEAIRRVVN